MTDRLESLKQLKQIQERRIRNQYEFHTFLSDTCVYYEDEDFIREFLDSRKDEIEEFLSDLIREHKEVRSEDE